MRPSSAIELPGGPHAALLFHGLAAGPLEVRFVGRLLHRAGFSVFMPVIAGYSMGSPGREWPAWLTGAEEIYLRLTSQYRTVSVAGLSSGATLALALAERQPGLLALALWSVTLQYDGWAIPWYQWLFRPGHLLGFGRYWAYREKEPFGLKNERWRARVAEAMRSSDASSAGPASIPADYLYQFTRLASYTERNLPRVQADALIVHAADDETASPRNAAAVYDRIGSAHKRKLLLGDSYHLITMDNERELVARETIRFFQQSIMHRHPEERLQLVSSARALLRLQRRRAEERLARGAR
ncbi:MAG TPA: alpha/beta fold hydrolase [Burkholderiales bacterium]|nr:alpha/beta fold hydrolase [Burkholderiales bacterium]